MATPPAISYQTYDMLSGNLLGELPLVNVSFSNVLNGGGAFRGQIVATDPKFNSQPSPYATFMPGKTILLAIVAGTICWSGIILSRTYTQSTGILEIDGIELEGYLGRLQQTRDYSAHFPGWGNQGFGTAVTSIVYGTYASTLWRTNPVPPVVAAAQVIGDTFSDLYFAYNQLGTANSGSLLNANVIVNLPSGYPSGAYHSEEKLPLSNHSSLDSLLQTMSMEHVTCGFDWHWAASLSGNNQVSTTLNLTWPRRGFDCTGGSGGALGTNTTGIGVIDSRDFVDYTYVEDSSSQATRVFALSGGIKGYRVGIGDVSYGFTTTSNIYMQTALPFGTPVTIQYGGSTYTANIRHITPEGTLGFMWKLSNWSPSTPSFVANQAIEAMVTGGPTSLGYPPMQKSSTYTAWKVDSQLRNLAFSELAQYQWPITTPTITVDAFGSSGFGLATVGDDIRVVIGADQRFLSGLDTYWRVVNMDWTISDTGQSTVTYSLDVPPSSSLSTGGFPGFRPPYQ